MIKGLISQVLARALGEYVEGITPSSIEYSIMSGLIQLNNLSIKREALDAFEVPFKIVKGSIGQVQVTLPGFRPAVLRAKPVQILIKDIFVLVDKAVLTPQEMIRRRASAKRSNLELAMLFQLRKLASEMESQNLLPSPDKDNANDAGLVTAIVDNLRVDIDNVHLRYVDSTSHPTRAFAIGVMFKKFSSFAQFVNSNAAEQHPKLPQREADLNSFSVYWDSLSSHEAEAELTETNSAERFRTQMANSLHDDAHDFLLRPSSARVYLTRNPRLIDGVPKISVELFMENPEFLLSRKQFCDATFLNIWIALHRYRPQQRLKDFTQPSNQATRKQGKQRSELRVQWWHYFMKCLLARQATAAGAVMMNELEDSNSDTDSFVSARETDSDSDIDVVSARATKSISRPRVDNNRMANYVVLYKDLIRSQRNELAQGEDLSQILENTLGSHDQPAHQKRISLEETFTYEQILFFRWLASAEVSQEETKRMQVTTPESTKPASTSSGWGFGSWLFGSAASSSDNKSSKKYNEAMYVLTDEERSGIYDLFDTSVMDSAKLAPDFQLFRVKVSIQSVSFELLDEYTLNSPRLLRCSSSCDLSMAIFPSSMRLSLAINELNVYHDVEEEKAFNHIIKTPYNGDVNENRLLYLEVVTKPTDDPTTDLRVRAESQSLHITPCPTVLARLAAFFAFEPATQLREQLLLQLQAMSASASTMNIEELLSSQNAIDADIKIAAPYIRLPMHASYEASEALTIYLGNIHITCNPATKWDQRMSDWMNSKLTNKETIPLQTSMMCWKISASDLSVHVVPEAAKSSPRSDIRTGVPVLVPVEGNAFLALSCLPVRMQRLRVAMDVRFPSIHFHSHPPLLRHGLMAIDTMNLVQNFVEDIQKKDKALMDWSHGNSVSMSSTDHSVQAATDNNSKEHMMAFRIHGDSIALSLHGVKDVTKTFESAEADPYTLRRFQMEDSSRYHVFTVPSYIDSHKSSLEEPDFSLVVRGSSLATEFMQDKTTMSFELPEFYLADHSNVRDDGSLRFLATSSTNQSGKEIAQYIKNSEGADHSEIPVNSSDEHTLVALQLEIAPDTPAIAKIDIQGLSVRWYDESIRTLLLCVPVLQQAVGLSTDHTTSGDDAENSAPLDANHDDTFDFENCDMHSISLQAEIVIRNVELALILSHEAEQLATLKLQQTSISVQSGCMGKISSASSNFSGLNCAVLVTAAFKDLYVPGIVNEWDTSGPKLPCTKLQFVSFRSPHICRTRRDTTMLASSALRLDADNYIMSYFHTRVMDIVEYAKSRILGALQILTNGGAEQPDLCPEGAMMMDINCSNLRVCIPDKQTSVPLKWLEVELDKMNFYCDKLRQVHNNGQDDLQQIFDINLREIMVSCGAREHDESYTQYEKLLQAPIDVDIAATLLQKAADIDVAVFLPHAVTGKVTGEALSAVIYTLQSNLLADDDNVPRDALRRSARYLLRDRWSSSVSASEPTALQLRCNAPVNLSVDLSSGSKVIARISVDEIDFVMKQLMTSTGSSQMTQELSVSSLSISEVLDEDHHRIVLRSSVKQDDTFSGAVEDTNSNSQALHALIVHNQASNEEKIIKTAKVEVLSLFSYVDLGFLKELESAFPSDFLGAPISDSSNQDAYHQLQSTVYPECCTCHVFEPCSWDVQISLPQACLRISENRSVNSSAELELQASARASLHTHLVYEHLPLNSFGSLQHISDSKKHFASISESVCKRAPDMKPFRFDSHSVVVVKSYLSASVCCHDVQLDLLRAFSVSSVPVIPSSPPPSVDDSAREFQRSTLVQPLPIDLEISLSEIFIISPRLLLECASQCDIKIDEELRNSFEFVEAMINRAHFPPKRTRALLDLESPLDIRVSLADIDVIMHTFAALQGESDEPISADTLDNQIECSSPIVEDDEGAAEIVRFSCNQHPDQCEMVLSNPRCISKLECANQYLVVGDVKHGANFAAEHLLAPGDLLLAIRDPLNPSGYLSLRTEEQWRSYTESYDQVTVIVRFQPDALKLRGGITLQVANGVSLSSSVDTPLFRFEAVGISTDVSLDKRFVPSSRECTTTGQISSKSKIKLPPLLSVHGRLCAQLSASVFNPFLGFWEPFISQFMFATNLVAIGNKQVVSNFMSDVLTTDVITEVSTTCSTESARPLVSLDTEILDTNAKGTPGRIEINLNHAVYAAVAALADGFSLRRHDYGGELNEERKSEYKFKLQQVETSFCLRNSCGLPVKFALPSPPDNGGAGSRRYILLRPGEEAPFNIYDYKLSALKKNAKIKNPEIEVQIEGIEGAWRPIPLSLSSSRRDNLTLPSMGYANDNLRRKITTEATVQVQTFENVRVFTLRSPLQIQNLTSQEFEVIIIRASSSSHSAKQSLGIVPSNGSLALPLNYDMPTSVQVRPIVDTKFSGVGYAASAPVPAQFEVYNSIGLPCVREGQTQASLQDVGSTEGISSTITCSAEEVLPPFNVSATCVPHQRALGYAAVVLQAPMMVANLLPCDVHYRIQDASGAVLEAGEIVSGESRESFCTVPDSASFVQFRLPNYTWTSSVRTTKIFNANDGDVAMLDVECFREASTHTLHQSRISHTENQRRVSHPLRLQVQCTREDLVTKFDSASRSSASRSGSRLAFAIYAPYWIVDRTSLGLTVGAKTSGSSRQSAAVATSIQSGELTEECYEHQRWYPFKGWSHNLMPTDRPRFCTEDGNREVNKDMIDRALPSGWLWKTEWQIDTCGLGKDGWDYEVDFPRFNNGRHYSNSECRLGDCVRRRRWIRTRIERPCEDDAEAGTQSRMRTDTSCTGHSDIETLDQSELGDSESLSLSSGYSGRSHNGSLYSRYYDAETSEAWLRKVIKKRLSLFYSKDANVSFKKGTGKWSECLDLRQAGASYCIRVHAHAYRRQAKDVSSKQHSLVVNVSTAPAPYQKTLVVTVDHQFWFVNATASHLALRTAAEPSPQIVAAGAARSVVTGKSQMVEFVQQNDKGSEFSNRSDWFPKVKLSEYGEYYLQAAVPEAGFVPCGRDTVSPRELIALNVSVRQHPAIANATVMIVTQPSIDDVKARSRLPSAQRANFPPKFILRNYTNLCVRMSQPMHSRDNARICQVCPPSQQCLSGVFSLSHNQDATSMPVIQLSAAVVDTFNFSEMKDLQFGAWQSLSLDKLGSFVYLETNNSSVSTQHTIVARVSLLFNSLVVSLEPCNAGSSSTLSRIPTVYRSQKFSMVSSKVLPIDRLEYCSNICQANDSGSVSASQYWDHLCQINIHGIGISIVDFHPSEVIYASFDKIRGTYTLVNSSQKPERTFGLDIFSYQIDDTSSEPHFPVILRPRDLYARHEILNKDQASRTTSTLKPALSICARQIPHVGKVILKLLEVRLVPLRIDLAYDFLSRASVAMYAAVRAMTSSRNDFSQRAHRAARAYKSLVWTCNESIMSESGSKRADIANDANDLYTLSLQDAWSSLMLKQYNMPASRQELPVFPFVIGADVDVLTRAALNSAAYTSDPSDHFARASAQYVSSVRNFIVPDPADPTLGMNELECLGALWTVARSVTERNVYYSDPSAIDTQLGDTRLRDYGANKFCVQMPEKLFLSGYFPWKIISSEIPESFHAMSRTDFSSARPPVTPGVSVSKPTPPVPTRSSSTASFNNSSNSSVHIVVEALGLQLEDLYAGRVSKPSIFEDRVYLQTMAVWPVQVGVSYAYTQAVSASGHQQVQTDDLARDVFARLPEVVQRIIRSGISINDAQITISSFAVTEAHLRIQALVGLYVEQVTRSLADAGVLAQIMLSSNAFGNVGGNIRQVSSSLQRALNETSSGVASGDVGRALRGLVLGTGGAAKETVLGAGGIVGDAVGFLGRGLNSVVDESASASVHRRHNSEKANIGSGVVQGFGNIGKGLFKGVTGIVSKPIQGASSGGASGFFKGIGKGLIGAVAHPLIGVSDGVSSIVGGANSSLSALSDPSKSGEDLRRRLPRVFIGWDMRMVEYDVQASRANDLLHKFTENHVTDFSKDLFLGYVGDASEGILILTSRHIVLTFSSASGRNMPQLKILKWSEGVRCVLTDQGVKIGTPADGMLVPVVDHDAAQQLVDAVENAAASIRTKSNLK